MTRFPGKSAVILLLALFSCEKSEPERAGNTGAKDTPATKAELRPSRSEDDEPDAKIALREAFDLAEKESDPAAREKALEAVAWDGIDVDPQLAREAFASLAPGGEAARRLVGHFAMRMADDDPDAALEWARSLDHSEERGDAIGRIAVVISATDAARAATLVADEMPEGPPRDRAIVQVVQRWSRSAPANAATWIASFPTGKVREAAMQSLATAWIEADAPAFEAWAVKQESMLPESAAAAAAALRNLPESSRNQRVDSFTDETFRQRVKEALED